MLSLYIHIPFCHHKCWYCSFNVIPLEAISNTLPTGRQEQQAASDDKNLELGTWGLKPIIITYLSALHRQIDDMKSKLWEQEIRTLYFGGWTPSIIGSDEMIKLIDHIASVRNLDYLEELSIEINPEPVDQMLDLISTISNRYKHFHRVRFSIGIQSFDNEVLEESGRQYNFQSCVDFLRKLTHIKMEHNVFNFDFIAFGKFNQTRKGDLQLRDPVRLDFFQRFVESGFADSFSLYTLELFEWSIWYNQQIANHNYEKAGFWLKKYGTDDDVYEEFELLKNIILDAGYQRYEISNYSKSWVNSIHNRVYRAMDERLGLGTWATSHLKAENLGKIISLNSLSSWAKWSDNETKSKDAAQQVPLGYLLSTIIKDSSTSSEWQKKEIYSWHISIVPDLKRFVAGTWIDDKKTEFLTETEYLKEKFLMGMRTMEGVQLWEKRATTHIHLQREKDKKEKPSYHHITPSHNNTITTILVPNREEKVTLFAEQDLCEYDGIRLRLTDQWMDIYNSIIIELMA